MVAASVYAEAGEVVMIDPDTNEAWHLPLLEKRQKIDVSGIGTYPPKNVIADYTRASHQILSSYVVSDLSGGMLVRDQQEATDISRYWHGTMQTRWPRQFVLARKPYAIAGAGTAVPLGDRGTVETLVAFGTALHKLTSDTASASVATLPAPPLPNGSATWSGAGGTPYLYIPLGSSGYSRWDGVTLTNVAGTQAVAFCRFDLGIYCLTLAGELLQSTDGSTWTKKAQLDRSEEMRSLVDFWDASDDPALHVVTDSAVYGIDLTAGKAYRIKGSPPRHAYAGKGCCEFRAELYSSYGMGVNKYSGGDFLPMGLDGRHGLPGEYRGNIIGLVDGYSAMYALVEGDTPDAQSTTETVIADSTAQSPSFSGDAGTHQIHAWDGVGWSPVWKGSPGSTVQGLVMAQAAGYRLLWGYGSSIYTLPMSSQFFNPLERYEAGPYEASSELISSIIDFNIVGQDKLLYAIEVIASNLSATAGSKRTVEVWYAIDGGGWQLLGTLDSDNAGKAQQLRLGAKGTFPGTDTPRYDGVPGDRIQLKLVGATEDATQTPVIESFGFVYHPLMGELDGRTFTVDCGENRDEYKGKTGAQRITFLKGLLPGKKLAPMQYRNEWRSVRVVGLAGTDETGVGLGAVRRVNVVEVG